MTKPFRYFNSSPEVIRLAVMLYIRCPLSLRRVEDVLFERGIEVCMHYLWRAVDHGGEMLEVLALKRRDRKAALEFLKGAMKRYGWPCSIVTDRLRSYRSAMKVIGLSSLRECERWLNSRTENSHQPFRRREGAMARFRDIKTLQKFVSVHATFYSLFNLGRHLNPRETFKQNRSAALAEWS